MAVPRMEDSCWNIWPPQLIMAPTHGSFSEMKDVVVSIRTPYYYYYCYYLPLFYGVHTSAPDQKREDGKATKYGGGSSSPLWSKYVIEVHSSMEYRVLIY